MSLKDKSLYEILHPTGNILHEVYILECAPGKNFYLKPVLTIIFLGMDSNIAENGDLTTQHFGDWEGMFEVIVYSNLASCMCFSHQ